MTLSVSVVSNVRSLSRPARNARARWAERSSSIITLESDDGGYGQGEAAPLPNFSPDTGHDCERALNELDLRDVPTHLLPEQDLTGELRRASARIPQELPAARAALEGALLDLWARAAGVPAWALLRPTAPRPASRAVAALLAGEPEQAVEQAMAARARGVGTFKFKIGRPDALERELLAVRALRAELGPHARLRLDANQALSLSQAEQYLPQFASYQLEFIEEPCAPREVEELRSLGLPCALDESLAGGARPKTGDRALILKPTLVGGISACLSLAEAARAVGAQVIVSHAFEGPLGFGLSAAIALSVGSDLFAHGLDLEGTGLEHLGLPHYSGAAVVAWSEPGFGVGRQL